MTASPSPAVTLGSRHRYQRSVAEFGRRPLEAERARAGATGRTKAGTAVSDGTVVASLEEGNALDNAGSNSGDGTARISVFVEKDDTRWMVAVRDRGIGIETDDADRIVQAFARLRSREEDDGTGVGLARCRRAAERRNGEITVDAESGEGSRLPVAVPAVSEPRTGPETTPVADADAVSATDE